MPWIEQKNDDLILTLRIVPRASKNQFAEVMGDALKVRIQAPPIDGKANAFLIKFLSKTWKIPRASFEILSGETGRNKRIKIHQPSDKIRIQLLSFKRE